jgi:hypothetical protein
VGKVTAEIQKNIVLGKKSHFSREIAENPTLRVGVEWVSEVKNTHVKLQKSLKSHPTRGSFQHPLCSDPRVGLSLAVMTLKTRFSEVFRPKTSTRIICKCFRKNKNFQKKKFDFFVSTGGTLCKLPKIGLKYKEVKIDANRLDQIS